MSVLIFFFGVAVGVEVGITLTALLAANRNDMDD